MAIVDTEYSEYAPRRPYVTPVVVQNRYLCFASSPTTGDVPLVSVFDTTTHTSRAFTMPGVTVFYDQHLFEWNDKLWVAGSGSGNFLLADLDLSTGTFGSTFLGAYASPSYVKRVGTKLWFTQQRDSSPYYMVFGYVDLTTYTVTRISTTLNPDNYRTVFHYHNGVIYFRDLRCNAATGAVLTSGNNTPMLQGDIDANGVLWYNSSGSLASWDLPGDTTHMTPVASGAIGVPCIGPDGLIYTVNNTTLRAINPTDSTVRDETLTNSRAERTRLVVFGGKLWTPSGYPT